MNEELIVFLLVLLVLAILVMPLVAVIMLAALRRRVMVLSAKLDAMLLQLDATREPPAPSRKADAVPGPKPDIVRVQAPAPAMAAAATRAPAPKPAPKPIPARAPALAPPPLPTVAVSPPAPAPAVPSEPGPVGQVFRKIWAWILMGGEERALGVTREYAIASWWLLVVGIVAVVACVAFFLRWSIESGRVGPAGRVALCVLFGVGMLVGGMRLLGRKYHVIAQGLLGGGLLTLYFSVFAAGSMYRLVPIPAAFALMTLVTVTAGILSVRTNSLLVAVLGLAGGYMTPVMLQMPDPSLAVLYAYILLLGIGIMGVARYREWRVLNYLGFLFTYALFLKSMQLYTRADFPVAMTFLAAFFVVHSSISFVHNIAREKTSTVLEVIHLTLNGVMFAGFAYHLIHDALGRPYPAVMSLSLAVFYMLHVGVFIRKQLLDKRLLVSLIALAGVFTTWTLPLVLEQESLTMSLALLAFMFLWLGGRLRSAFIENLGHVLYAVVFVRLLWMDMPRNFRGGGAATAPMGDYWKAMLERLWTFGVSIASVAAAFLLERRRRASKGSVTVPAASDTPRVAPAGVATQVFYWCAVLFAFAFVYLEMNTLLAYGESFRLPVLTVLWCAMAVYFMAEFLRSDGVSGAMFAAMLVFLAIGTLKLFALDLASWKPAEHLVYMAAYSPLIVAARFLDFAAVLGVLLAAWYMIGRQRASASRAAAFGYGAVVLFFIYASLETNSLLYWHSREFREGGMSILWAAFAIAFISAGIWKDLKPLRYGGLVLFVIVVGKVFLVDLSDMEIIHRVIAFMIVGVALLLGSFAYIFAGKKFEQERQ